MTEPSIRHEKMSDIFHKYHIENFGVDAVLHEFLEAEPEDALAHDHPFDFTSFVIEGWYVEMIWERNPFGFWYPRHAARRKRDTIDVDAETVHQITAVSPGGCKTLILPVPVTRKSGFWKFTPTENKDLYTGEFRAWDQEEFVNVTSR